MSMGRTGANPMAGNGGVVLRMNIGPPPPFGAGLGAWLAALSTAVLAEVGALADEDGLEAVACLADKVTVATRPSVANPSRIVTSLPLVFIQVIYTISSR